jgi:Tol biopolymer transport system component
MAPASPVIERKMLRGMDTGLHLLSRQRLAHPARTECDGRRRRGQDWLEHERCSRLQRAEDRSGRARSAAILTLAPVSVKHPPRNGRRLRCMKRLGRRIHGHVRAVAALVVAAAAAGALVVGSMVDERRNTPAAAESAETKTGETADGGSSSVEPAPVNPAQVPPHVDYLLDLNTGATTPLPKSILRSQGDPIRSPRYAASPNGGRLAYVGRGDEGRPQIFVARIGGSGLRQVTHDPKGADSPAWSPDGTKIAYEGYGSRHRSITALFVLDVATGESRRIIDESHAFGAEPQFTPDGSSLLYTGGTYTAPVLRTVPITGGRSTLLIGPGDELEDAGNGSLSPDGSLITFQAAGHPQSGTVEYCGPCRWLANADGTNKRVILGCFSSSPAGTWSPDDGRIVCVSGNEKRIVVVDVVAGNVSKVGPGSAAIWLDRTTLLVET